MRRVFHERLSNAAVTISQTLGIYFGPKMPTTWTSNLTTTKLIELPHDHVAVLSAACMMATPTGGENLTAVELALLSEEDGGYVRPHYLDVYGIGAANSQACARYQGAELPIRFSYGIVGRMGKNAGVQGAFSYLTVVGIIMPRGTLQT